MVIPAKAGIQPQPRYSGPLFAGGTTSACGDTALICVHSHDAQALWIIARLAPFASVALDLGLHRLLMAVRPSGELQAGRPNLVLLPMAPGDRLIRLSQHPFSSPHAIQVSLD
jgi:hypothetical protein